MLKRLIFAFLIAMLVCGSAHTQINPYANQPKDSLEKWLPTLDGIDKLCVLEELIMHTFNNTEEEAVRYIEEMYEVGMIQKEYKYAIFAMLKQMQLLAGEKDYKNAILKLEEAERLSEELETYNYYSYIQATIVLLHTYEGDFAKALSKGEKMYASAKKKGGYLDMYEAAEMIGNIYEQMSMYPDALKYYNEALWNNKEYEKNKHSQDHKIAYHEQRNVDIYENMGSVYYKMNDYEKLELYTDSMLHSVYKSVEEDDKSIEYYAVRLFRAEFFYGYAAIQKGDIEKGWKHIQKAEELFNSEWVFTDVAAEEKDALNFLYYKTIQNYPKALEYCEKRIAYYRITEDMVELVKNLLFKAQLEHEMGNVSEAIVTYEEYIKLSDEINKKQYYAQLHELRTIYELDKAEMLTEQERQKLKSTRNLLIALATILLLILILVVVMVINRRRLRIKNKKLFAQITNQDTLIQETNHWKEETIKMRALLTSVTNAEEIKEVEHEDILYSRLDALMSDPEVFTDPELTRKSVAEKLGTNERYLFDLIKKYSGMNFTEYIVMLRLDHARRLLSDFSSNYTIEAVAIDVGFGSRVTLHRHFKSRYGLTPDEFRNLFRETESVNKK